MRVLFVTPAFHPALHYGGPIQSMYQLCLGMHDLGVEVDVLTTDANGPVRLTAPALAEQSERSPYKVHYQRRISGTLSPSLIAAIPNAARVAEVVHLTGVFSSPTIPTLLASTVWGRPLVWSTRGSLQIWEGTRHLTAKRFWMHCCRAAISDRVVVHSTSNAELEVNRSWLPTVRHEVVANPVVLTPAGPLPPPPGLSVLFMGRLDPIKAIENLIEAFALLKRRLSVARLLIAGGGPAPYLEKLHTVAHASGVSGDIEFLGEVYGEQRERAFASASMLVLPSHRENFGMVVPEALSRGIPVVASRGTPWQELQDAGCGIWVENTPRSLSEAMYRLATAQSSWTLRERCRAWVTNRYGLVPIARRMVDIYESLSTSSAIAA